MVELEALCRVNEAGVTTYVGGNRYSGKATALMSLRPLLFFGILCTCVLAQLTGCGKTEHRQGHALYDQHCANCHMEEGVGLRQLIPPLAGSDYLRENPAEVVRGIVYGMEGPMTVNGVTYNQPMPGNEELTEFQVVNIVNYINSAWGNDYPEITVTQTREWLGEAGE